ncbi:MAG: sugar transferase [Firmicutes bacterium]|nr:sugar transferase [Bacillota bacterium]
MIKRLMDFWGSLFALMLISPFFLVVAVAIKLDSSGPVFFRQERAGKDGRVFKIFKFRTMVVDAETMGAGVFVEKEDSRITKVGKWLRDTSLDELPQLINVLLGEMSLVGPRPTLPYQVERYDERQRQRLLLRPGITGWAQVSGRNSLTWPEKIELDIWYVENRSLRLDIRILWQTIYVIFDKQDLYSGLKGDQISGVPLNKDKGGMSM